MWKNVVAPTLLVTLFWGVSSIATAYYISWLESLPARMILDNLSTIHAADEMRHTLGDLNRTVFTAPRPFTPETRATVARLEAQFQKHYNVAVTTCNSAEERLIDPKIQTLFEEYRQELHRQLDAPPDAGGVQIDDFKRLSRLTGKISEQEVQLGAVNERQMREIAASRHPSSASLTAIRYGFQILGPLAGIVLGFWISRRFHRSISQISITLDDAASEMTEHVGRVDVRTLGELPRLQEQVNAVVKRIRDVVQQLHEARRQAIGTARLAAIGEMAAGVAHEIRNPLTSVKLLIQTGAQRTDRKMTEKQYSVVLEEISRMETTIERMLDFARPPQMNRRRHDLQDIVNHALSVNEGRAHHANVSVASEILPAPVMVNADSEQLHQVFSNLLQNGIEAMPAGGVLCVRIEKMPERGRCRVVFADTGPGICDAVMKRMFEPFVTDKARGTGLGLAVSHRIVLEHEGVLTAANLPGGGAEFAVELPLDSQPPAVTVSEAITALSSASEAVDLNRSYAHAEVAHH